MPTGRVASFDPEKGCGFVSVDGGASPDVIIDRTAVRGENLKVGQRLSFIIEKSKMGQPRAARVTVLSDDGSAVTS